MSYYPYQQPPPAAGGGYHPQQGAAYPPPPPPHGAPPYGHQPYGAAPPPPPPHAQYPYAAPPPPHHAAYPQQPPPPQAYPGGYGVGVGGAPAAYGYGAPPQPPPSGFRFNGVAVPPPPPHQPAPPPPGYNVQRDVEEIRRATKGFGTDEKSLIATIAPLDPFQVDAVVRQFKVATGKDLVTVIEKETSGYFEYTLRLKLLGPVGGDCWLINRACRGAGTHEDLLTEVLLGRTNQDIWTLKQAYKATYGKELDKAVESELSMKTRRLFAMALQGARADDAAPVDARAVEADVQSLKSAARGAGTDEITICSILVSRSSPHLAAVARSYQARYHQSLSAMVQSEFSGHMRDALLHLAEGAQGHGMGVERDARALEASVAGAGTKDERLAYRVVRLHWDRPRFEEVKRAYAGLCHKRGLRSRVEGETSGHFERALVAIIGH